MRRQRNETGYFAKITALVKGCSQTTVQCEMHTGLLVPVVANQSLMFFFMPFQMVFASEMFFPKKEESDGSLYSPRQIEHFGGPALAPHQSYGRLSYLSLAVAAVHRAGWL